MKKNKPTYITDLTTEILSNSVLLNTWAKASADMEFLKLSVATLSDIDLLFSWDCNNVLNVKLAGVLSGNQDFKLKSGMLITIDESYMFPVKASLYKKNIKLLIDKQEGHNLEIQDLLNQGYSLEEIEKKERFIKMNNFLNVVEKTKNYTSKNMSYYLENFLPQAIKRYKKERKELFKKKADELFYPLNEKNEVNELKTANQKKEIKEVNPFPLLFTNHNVYTCFLDYQKHIIDFYGDYSYLKKRLEDEELTHYQKDNDFMKIVFEHMNLISKKNYEDYLITGKLDSLKRTSTPQRENNFNNIFGC